MKTQCSQKYVQDTFLPGKSHGQRRLTGYSPKGHKELDMTERLSNSNSIKYPQFYYLIPLEELGEDQSVVITTRVNQIRQWPKIFSVKVIFARM